MNETKVYSSCKSDFYTEQLAKEDAYGIIIPRSATAIATGFHQDTVAPTASAFKG